jgi:hypothetical protein
MSDPKLDENLILAGVPSVLTFEDAGPDRMRMSESDHQNMETSSPIVFLNELLK